MNYEKIYNDLCNSRKIRGLKKEFGCEVHHIIPRSMGGDNSDDNLVKLTRREHLLCHKLLTKFLTGHHKYKMLAAYSLMTKDLNSGRNVYMNKLHACAREYHLCLHTKPLKSVNFGSYNLNSRYSINDKVFSTLQGFFLLRLFASVHSLGFIGLNIPFSDRKLNYKIRKTLLEMTLHEYIKVVTETNMRDSKYFIITDKLENLLKVQGLKVLSHSSIFEISAAGEGLKGFIGVSELKIAIKAASLLYPELLNLRLMVSSIGVIKIRPLTTYVVPSWRAVEKRFDLSNCVTEF